MRSITRFDIQYAHRFSVPKVAAWLIQSTGSNNAHNNAGRAASAAVATVAKAVV